MSILIVNSSFESFLNYIYSDLLQLFTANFEMSIERLVEILLSKLKIWLESGVAMLPNLIIAGLVVVIALSLARLIQKGVFKAFNRLSDNPTISSLLGVIVYLAILAVGLFIALGVLNLDKAASSLLAGLGVLGLAIGFAFQEIATNFISGIFIAISKPFKVGDIVEIKGTTGTVDHISLRTTCILTDEGQMVDIPNKEMFTSQLKNFTSSRRQRFTFSFQISQNSDLEQAKNICDQALESFKEKVPNLKADVYYTSITDVGFRLSIFYWLNLPTPISATILTSEMIMKLKAELQRGGVEFATTQTKN